MTPEQFEQLLAVARQMSDRVWWCVLWLGTIAWFAFWLALTTAVKNGMRDRD